MKNKLLLLPLLVCTFLMLGCSEAKKTTIVCVNPFLYEKVNTQLNEFLANSGQTDSYYVKTDIEMYIANIESQFSQKKNFALVDRSKIEEVLNEEHAFELSEFSSRDKIAEIGKVLNANKIITFEPRYSIRNGFVKDNIVVGLTVAISDVNTLETVKVYIENIYGKTGKLKYPKIKKWNINNIKK